MANLGHDIVYRLHAWSDALIQRSGVLAKLIDEAREEIVALRKKNAELAKSLADYEAQDL